MTQEIQTATAEAGAALERLAMLIPPCRDQRPVAGRMLTCIERGLPDFDNWRSGHPCEPCRATTQAQEARRAIASINTWLHICDAISRGPR